MVFNNSQGLGDDLMSPPPQNRSFIVKYTHQFEVFN